MMLEGITWLGHASFRIDEPNYRIYIDPWKLNNPKPADLILVTHAHRDHMSLDDIALIAGPDTIIVAPVGCRGQIPGDVRIVAPGDTLDLGLVTIEAVHSYNLNKPNHPRSADNVGYVLQVGGRRIYHAGDTDLVDEMSHVHCDVAMLPVGGTYTMNVEEAVEAVGRIHPGLAIPMHYGDIIGDASDAQRFAQALEGQCEVAILTVES